MIFRNSFCLAYLTHAEKQAGQGEFAFSRVER